MVYYHLLKVMNRRFPIGWE